MVKWSACWRSVERMWVKTPIRVDFLKKFLLYLGNLANSDVQRSQWLHTVGGRTRLQWRWLAVVTCLDMTRLRKWSRKYFIPMDAYRANSRDCCSHFFFITSSDSKWSRGKCTLSSQSKLGNGFPHSCRFIIWFIVKKLFLKLLWLLKVPVWYSCTWRHRHTSVLILAMQAW